MFDFLILSGVGCLLYLAGFYTFKKEDPRLVHSYHYSKVKEEDLPDYARAIGKSLMLMAVSMILAGIINFVFTTLIGWYLFIVGFAAGMYIFFKVQKKFNGGVF